MSLPRAGLDWTALRGPFQPKPFPEKPTELFSLQGSVEMQLCSPVCSEGLEKNPKKQKHRNSDAKSSFLAKGGILWNT